MGHPMAFTSTADERGLTLPDGGVLYFEAGLPDNGLGSDGDRSLGPDGATYGKVSGAWAARGGGGAFAVAAQGSGSMLFVTSADSSDLTAYDAKANQASVPAKPSLIVLSATLGMTATVGTDAGGSLSVFMFPAKPLSANEGAIVQTTALDFELAVTGTDGTATGRVTEPLRVPFVLPAGWWWVGVFAADGDGTTAEGLAWVDYPLG